MPSKTQLTGGAFQDAEGNLLVNGYLKFKLSQDSSVSGVGNICSGIEITIQLDSVGNVASSTSTPTAPNQYVWATDVFTTPNMFYRVTGYTAGGQPSWGPNNQQVTSGGTGGGTFNVGTWTPNQVLSWTPPPSGVTLQHNGVSNSSQNLLNLESTNGSVSITDAGGGSLDLSAGGGTGFAIVATNFDGFTGSPVVSIANTAWQLVAGNMLLQSANSWTIDVHVGTTSVISQQWAIARTARNSVTVIDWTPITWNGGNASPTLVTGFHTSDVISLAIDKNHDYWFGVYGGNLSGYHLDSRGTAQLLYGGSAGPGVANLIGGSTITDASGAQPPVQGTIYQWLAAWVKVS